MKGIDFNSLRNDDTKLRISKDDRNFVVMAEDNTLTANFRPLVRSRTTDNVVVGPKFDQAFNVFESIFPDDDFNQQSVMEEKIANIGNYVV